MFKYVHLIQLQQCQQQWDGHTSHEFGLRRSAASTASSASGSGHPHLRDCDQRRRLLRILLYTLCASTTKPSSSPRSNDGSPRRSCWTARTTSSSSCFYYDAGPMLALFL